MDQDGSINSVFPGVLDPQGKNVVPETLNHFEQSLSQTFYLCSVSHYYLFFFLVLICLKYALYHEFINRKQLYNLQRVQSMLYFYFPFTVA